MLIEKGRIGVDRNPIDWMERSLLELGIELLPLTPADAVRRGHLAEGHRRGWAATSDPVAWHSQFAPKWLAAT